MEMVYLMSHARMSIGKYTPISYDKTRKPDLSNYQNKRSTADHTVDGSIK
jgi:hypothetical protein